LPRAGSASIRVGEVVEEGGENRGRVVGPASVGGGNVSSSDVADVEELNHRIVLPRPSGGG
jgi:hypothetical protein